eukprot:c19937_g1_i1 orf=161-2350(-)
MTSKLTSRIVCAHNPNKGEFEFGGVSVKGCCGKVRWNTVRQGDMWINGLFSEDEFLTSNHNPSVISLQTVPESCTNEHLEVDWISKELAYQDLICSDRSSHWSDTNIGKSDFIKEEHDMDIISTLTAVAALFRDWCVLETDLSQPVLNENSESMSSLEMDNHDDFVWINDAKVEGSKAVDTLTSMPMQSDLLQWSHYDVAWDDFIKERLKSQQMMYHAFFHHGFAQKEVESVSRWFPDVADFEDGSHGCQEHLGTDWYTGNRAEEEFYSFKHSLQYSRETVESQDIYTNAQFGKESVLAAYKELDVDVEPFVELGLQDQYAMFESQHPTASRYSFGREGDAGSLLNLGEIYPTAMTLKEQPGNGFIFDKGLNLTDTIHSGTWFGSKAGKVLPSLMSEEKKWDDCNFRKGLLLAQGASQNMDFSSDNEDKGNEVSMHEAMSYALSYMSLQDLLTMEKVSKSLKDWIRNDVLLWQQLHVEPPLSKGLTDEVLLELASRSKGQLWCLNLVDCTKVTEAAVEQVVLSNPRLTKLCLPGCTRISADSVVRMVEVLAKNRRSGLSCLKQLRIRNIYGLTREHLATLENMVGARSSYKRKPRYYHNGHSAFCDDERPIDVEECPKCTNVRLVYDCTRERCQQMQGLKFQECRACFLCTVRCEECGRCINDNDYEETFSLDLLCSCCWLRLPKCAACSRPGCGRHADHFIRSPETMFAYADCCGTSDARGPEFHVHA